MAAVTEAWSVACPRCQSQPQVPCLGIDGHARNSAHLERHRAFAGIARKKRRVNKRDLRQEVEAIIQKTTGYSGKRGRMADLCTELVGLFGEDA